MNLRRLDFYAPLAALFLALVALLSTSAALDRTSDSLEKLGRKFSEAEDSLGTSGVLLAGLSAR